MTRTTTEELDVIPMLAYENGPAALDWLAAHSGSASARA